MKTDNSISNVIDNEKEYVCFWSKAVNSNYWLLERTHTKQYAESLITPNMNESTLVNGRHYKIFAEGINPNNKQ